MYRAKYLFNKSFLKTAYYSYIHSYLTYANIAWASAYQTKLKTVHYHHKRVVQLVSNQEKLTRSRPLLQLINALNAYQINLYQYLNFMHKVTKNGVPLIFNDMFKKSSHKYPTNFWHNNFSLKKCSLNSTKYSFFGLPKLWNEFLNTDKLVLIICFQEKLNRKLNKEKVLKYFGNLAEIVISNLDFWI